MGKEKVTITLDRAEAEVARGLAGAASTSEFMHSALNRRVRGERLRRDVEAYRRVPQTAAERALAAQVDDRGLDNDVDWEALYADAE